jgi:4-hydroxybenzoate polyprenyltransferase
MVLNANRFDFKIDKWWIYKIAGGIVTWYLILLNNEQVFTWGVLHRFAEIIGLYILLAITGHLLNDYGDIKLDSIANKRNFFGSIRKYWHKAILFILVSITLGLTYIAAKFSVFSGLVVLQITISILYAIPPFRLKERGVLAVIFTGFYERVIPYLMMLFWVGITIDFPHFFLAYLFWSYLWECRNCLNGQLVDHDLDAKNKVSTFAVRVGRFRTTQLIQYVFLVEIIVLLLSAVIMLFSDGRFDVFILFALLLFVVTVFSDTKSFKSKIQWADEVYNKVFMVAASFAMLFVDIRYWGLLILLHLFFFDLYRPYYHFLYYNFWHRILLALVLPSIKGVFAAIVNYSIYYFRRYILRWTKKKSRGGKGI